MRQAYRLAPRGSASNRESRSNVQLFRLGTCDRQCGVRMDVTADVIAFNLPPTPASAAIRLLRPGAPARDLGAGRFGSMWDQSNVTRHGQRDLVIASLLLCPDEQSAEGTRDRGSRSVVVAGLPAEGRALTQALSSDCAARSRDHARSASVVGVSRHPRVKTGDRVALCGNVSYARGGFVLVRWDDGTTSLVWGADLTAMPR